MDTPCMVFLEYGYTTADYLVGVLHCKKYVGSDS